MYAIADKAALSSSRRHFYVKPGCSRWSCRSNGLWLYIRIAGYSLPGVTLMSLGFYEGRPCTSDICTSASPIGRIVVLLRDRTPEWVILLLSRLASAVLRFVCERSWFASDEHPSRTCANDRTGNGLSSPGPRPRAESKPEEGQPALWPLNATCKRLERWEMELMMTLRPSTPPLRRWRVGMSSIFPVPVPFI